MMKSRQIQSQGRNRCRSDVSRQFAEDAGHYKEDQTWAALHIDSACECGWNNYKAGKDGSTGIADGYKNGIAL